MGLECGGVHSNHMINELRHFKSFGVANFVNIRKKTFSILKSISKDENCNMIDFWSFIFDEALFIKNKDRPSILIYHRRLQDHVVLNSSFYIGNTKQINIYHLKATKTNEKIVWKKTKVRNEINLIAE